MNPSLNPFDEPSWEALFADAGNKNWLAAKALLELDPHRTVQRDAARWITSSGSDGHLADSGEWVWELELDWVAWVADVDERGRGWSSSEHRLFQVVASLVAGRPFPIAGVLDQLGSWEVGAWRILAAWGTR